MTHRRGVLVAVCAVLGALLGALLLGACGDSAPRAADAVVAQVPFRDGEQLTYALHDDAGAIVGRGTLITAREGAQWTLRQGYREADPPAGQQPTSDTSRVSVHERTLEPSRSERIIAGRREAEQYAADYGTDDGKPSVQLQRDDDVRTLTLPINAYDNESSLWLWRTLAFADDYESRYVSVNLVERTRQVVSLRVTGRQRVDVPAGSFETWRLQIRNGRATRVAWVNVEAPHQIVQWDNGAVVFRLESAR